MSDDDLNKGASGDDFEFEDDDEFNIQESPEDDLLAGDDEDLLAGELDNDDLGDLDVEDDPEDEDDAGANNEPEQDPLQTDGGSEGAGWKLWAGVGVAMAAVFSALMWFAFGLMGNSQSAAPDIKQADMTPTPPTAKQKTVPEKQKVTPLPVAKADEAPKRISGAQAQTGTSEMRDRKSQSDTLPLPEKRETAPNAIPSPGQNYGREVTDNNAFPPIDGGALKGLETALTENSNQIGSLGETLSDSIDQSGKQIDSRLSDVTKKLAEIADKLDGLDGRDTPEQQPTDAKTDNQESRETVAKQKAQRKRVRKAQIRLKAFGYQPGRIDGIFGSHTASAAKRFQRQYDLTVTGELDGPTMSHLMGTEIAPYQAQQEMASSTARTARVSENETSPLTGDRWFVRGVTASRAIIYQHDGSSYLVESGTEVPGKGQVAKLNPGQHSITLVGGEVIRRQ